jgi:predicted CoA-binding protein
MAQVCEIPIDNVDDPEIKEILDKYSHIAIIGLSSNEEKPSYQVAKYLMEHNYSIYPVNPKYEEILGVKCYPNLSVIPDPIEIVDIFRKPSAVPEIVEDAIKCGARVIWMQLGIVNNQAAQRAKEAGLKVVMSKCMMVEHKRLIKSQT